MIRIETGLDIGDLPVACWRNVVTATNVSAESDPDFPASNAANPSTALKWKHDAVGSPVTATEYFRVDVSESINYVAIAGHNFGSAGIGVGLELTSFTSPLGGGQSIFEPRVPDDDRPIVFLFQDQEVEDIRIILLTTATPAEIAVVYAGEYTQFEEGIQPDHTPLPLARVSEVVSGKSENGAFLGRIITNEGLASTATIANLSKSFARDELVPFLEFASEFPFFWLWSPETYPEDSAFAWLENDPQPVFDIDGYVSIDLAMRGLGA